MNENALRIAVHEDPHETAKAVMLSTAEFCMEAIDGLSSRDTAKRLGLLFGGQYGMGGWT